MHYIIDKSRKLQGGQQLHNKQSCLCQSTVELLFPCTPLRLEDLTAPGNWYLCNELPSSWLVVQHQNKPSQVYAYSQVAGAIGLCDLYTGYSLGCPSWRLGFVYHWRSEKVSHPEWHVVWTPRVYCIRR